jgi:hypothetical protein
MLADVFPQIDHVYVDQELLVPNRPVKRPDLTIVMDAEIRLMVDVKMDLGRDRKGLPDLAAEAAELVEELAQLPAGITINARTQEGRIPQPLTVSRRCEYVFLVVSGTNISGAELQNAIWDWVGPLPKWACVHRIVLRPTVHPNDPRLITAGAAVTELTATLSANAMRTLEEVCNRTLQR